MLNLTKLLSHIFKILRINGMYTATLRMLIVFFAINILSINNLKSQQFKSEKELRTEADRLFNEDEFTKAYNLFAQLVALYPKDAELNYKLGVCMLYSEADKKKCFSYLRFAASNTQDAPKDAIFYYAKAFHINYLFDEALKYYKEYQKVASASQLKKLQVEKEINACINGKRLLASMSELIVINKKQLNEADYFRSYDLSTIGGKLLVKPDIFRTAYDKKKKEKSVIYIPKSGDKIFFSSLGEKGETGRDIYYATKVTPDKYSNPVKLPTINSEYDEDYPFLHPDGKTLYFSSKGFNSMGGYDIFKSVYNEETNSWSSPVNLEFPINSPDDDYLFVTDSSEKFAYFSTGRQSPPGKIDVLKVKTERIPMTIAFIKGTVLKEEAKQSLLSKITVKNMDDGKIVGVFQAKDNGDYTMEVPNGGKLLFTVETPGIPVQSDKVILPMATSFSPFKQSITYDNKILKIINYFDSPPDDNSYLQYLELIEKKAKLEVNENDVKAVTSQPLATNKTPDAVKTNNPTVVSNESPPTLTNETPSLGTAPSNSVGTTFSNDQLITIAKEDAKEAKDEALKLKQDALDAKEFGEAKKIEADKLSKQYEDAQNYANTTIDPIKKENALLEATKIKNDAEEAGKVASTILNLAKSLETDADIKQKEADLNDQYAKELEFAAKNKNNKEALVKADKIQKELESITKQQKESDLAYSKIKNEYEAKQTEIVKAENASQQIKKDIADIDKEIKINESEINSTKDKSLKKSLAAQVIELKTDKEKKNEALANNEKTIEKLKEEASATETEMYLVNQIKTTDSKTSVANVGKETTSNIPVSTINNTTTITSSKSKAEILTAKYADKLALIQNDQSPEKLQKENLVLSEYNKELTNLLVANNNKINSSKNETEKNNLKNENTSLQKLKDTNIQTIAANSKKINENPINVATKSNEPSTNSNSIAISNNPSSSNSTPNFTPTPVNFNGSDDKSKLNSLKASLTTDDLSAFEFKGYKDLNSLNLKKEADSKLEAVNNTKSNLETSISKAEATFNTVGNPKEALLSEGDAFANQAKEKRNVANTSTGEEKDKLLKEAREFDKQANQKYLAASEVNKKQNQASYEINSQNLTEMINQALYFNKNTPDNTANLMEAQKLQSEANTYFSQAKSIREEANSLGSDAAKLGTIGNAEEKEAEALEKQSKALKALLKSNPNFKLKKPEESNVSGDTEALAQVKSQFDQLNQEKLDAYLALSKANQNEYKAINNNLNSNPIIKSNSNQEASALKKKAENLNTQAVGSISKALIEQNPELKQKLLNDANKKEIEALKLLDQASNIISSSTIVSTESKEPKNSTNSNETPIANENTNETNPNENNTNEPVNTQSVTTQPVKSIVKSNEPENKNNTTQPNSKTNDDPIVSNTDPNLKSNSEPSTTKNNTSTNSNVKAKVPSNNVPYTTANSTTINPEYKTVKDSDVKAVISYIDTNPVPYKNSEATTLKSNAINNLIAISEEQTKVEDEIKMVPGSEINYQAAEENINKLLNESDNYGLEASAKRKELNAATGPDKDLLINEIQSLENKSFAAKTKASQLQYQLNETQFVSYTSDLANYFDKAKSANASELPKAEELLSEILEGKKQAEKLRNEANNITNNAAKIGAISNVEEKEAEIIAKQKEVITLLKKYDAEYKSKPIVIASKPEDNMSPELKSKYELVLTKQNTELESIAKSNIMEYETVNEQLPVILNATQTANKTLADNLITESKKLNTQANQSSDLKEKKELLTLSAKKGQEALVAINKTFDKGLIAKNNSKPVKEKPIKVVKDKPIKEKPISESSEPTVSTKIKTNKNSSGNNSVNLTVSGLEVKVGNAYSSSNPIPLDTKIPDGLIFRVQVGAFKNPVPNSTFKGLKPVNAQTTNSGFIRYTVGNFEKFEDATGVKNDLRSLGYSDAFVVVFLNGERITMNEAINILQKEGKEVNALGNQSAGIIATANLPKNIAPAIPKSEELIVTKELEKINGLLFTIQIGVYSREVTRSGLWKLEPIYTEKLPTGLYRYTAGIYNNRERVIADKRRVVDLGIKDAFVSAYLNGKRISFTDAEKMKNEDANIKMEAENPIVFPGESSNNNSPINNLSSNSSNVQSEPQPTIAPFKNNVVSAPIPTAENGVKLNDEGITYKVQIGAYRNQVPSEVADKFLNIKSWPVDAKFVNGLYIYSVGSFSEAKFAKQLKDEVVSLGVADAFITVYQNGKKLYGQEATNYLNR